MKRLFLAALAAVSSFAFAATTIPPQAINPTGSTAGQAIVSTGASGVPGWGSVSVGALTGVLPIANGGTNCSTASGTCLDNIAAFSSTGFIQRTGAGAYSFTGSTGSGSVVLSTSPTLVTPNLGTPSAVTLTNGTALPISTGVSGLGTGVATALGNAVTGSGSVVLSNSPTLTGTTNVASVTATGTVTGFSGRLLNVQKFTSSGTYSPTSGATWAIVVGVGGGGGGGGTGATAAGQVALAGPGSAGAWGIARITSLSSQTVTIGAAGTGGAAGANAGGNGGQTSIGTWLVCPGGIGGPSGVASSISSTTVAGLPALSPSAPTSSGTLLEGSPGAAGDYAVWGFNGAGAVLLATGGNSRFGAGGFTTSLGAGANGNGNGSGGSGGSAGSSAAATAGGNGAIGLILVYEYQ